MTGSQSKRLLVEEQHRLQEAAIAFARAEISDDIVRRDRNEEFSRAAWNKLAEFGIFSMPLAAEYGDLGLKLTDVIAVMEGLGYAMSDHGLLFSIHAHLWTNSLPIQTFGTRQQQERYLPRLASGEWIGANAASEPNAGSDIFAMRTRAERRGDVYVLNGSKTFVTNAPVADVFVAYATVDPALGSMGITAFIVERNTPGLKLGNKLEKMGLRT